MSPRRLGAILALLVLTFTAGASSVLLAEVSSDRAGDRRVTTLLMDLTDDINGMTDGADPIPNVRWDPYRRIPEPRVLNREGAIRKDGRPDVAFFPQIFTPAVVWAWNHQTDHDIALALWTPEGWSATHFLTHDRTADEVEPRIYIDRMAGLHVVWAVDGFDPHVVYLRRQANGTWRPPVRVTPPGEVARRPSVASVGHVLVVAYEREATMNGETRKAVIVRRLSNTTPPDGDVLNFDVNHAFPVPRRSDLQPILHVRGGRLWIDWKHTDAHLGWAVFEDQEWSEVRLHTWDDPSWVGVEDAREAIQHLILSPKPPDPFE